MVNVRSLSENYNTMYSDRYTPSQCLSWVPPSATPPPFLVERIRQQQHDHRQFGKAEPKRGLAEVPRSKNKRFKLWWNDAEVKRRRRVAKYKLYGAEGKMKMSFKRGYRPADGCLRLKRGRLKKVFVDCRDRRDRKDEKTVDESFIKPSQRHMGSHC
ncbi:hypothetical protein ACLB2K_060825 [Fragaria x ananassa]